MYIAIGTRERHKHLYPHHVKPIQRSGRVERSSALSYLSGTPRHNGPMHTQKQDVSKFLDWLNPAMICSTMFFLFKGRIDSAQIKMFS